MRDITLETEWWIPGNTPSSKNNRRWTGTYFIASKATMRWRKNTEGVWIQYRDSFLLALTDLTPPFFIELTFARATKHRFDYINIAQGVLDAMVTHEWLTDDDTLNVKPYFGDAYYDKINPGVKIKILKQKPIHYDLQNTDRSGKSIL